MRIRISKPHDGSINSWLCENSLAEPIGQPMIAPCSNVEYLEFGMDADAFRVRTTGERPVLLGSSIDLHLESLRYNLFDDGGFGGQVPLSIGASDPEPSGQEQHIFQAHPKPEINLIAVMLGKKQ